MGCAPLHRRQAEMPPGPAETLPEWAFDAPSYFRPPPDAVPAPVNDPSSDEPAHYFVNRKVILIDRPANNVPVDHAPRIAVWWTNTDGCEWVRAGFFGVGQTHFAFVAGDDGDYGIRFVGPGIRESLLEEVQPHRVYHLDTCPPVVVVSLDPDRPVYDPGETIMVEWTATDLNLDDEPVRLAICWTWENPGMLNRAGQEDGQADPFTQEEFAGRLWQPMKRRFKSHGIFYHMIPTHASGEGLQIQVRAKDRAGNFGIAYSKVILVSGFTSPPTTAPAQAATTQPGAAATQPARSSYPGT